MATGLTKTTSRTTALALLPGQTAVDDALVAAAVAEINTAWATGHLAAALHVGDLIVERFFDGSAQNAHSRSRTHASFKALEKHPGLRMKATDLWYAISIFEQYPSLEAAVADALSVGHHRQLVHVSDVERRREYARQAVENGLTVAELRRAIQTAQNEAPAERSRRGRRPLPEVVKSLSKVTVSFRSLRHLTPAAVAALEGEQRITVVNDAREFAEQVATWWAGIQVAEANNA